MELSATAERVRGLNEAAMLQPDGTTATWRIGEYTRLGDNEVCVLLSNAVAISVRIACTP